MAALTSSRNTPEMADFGRTQIYPVEASTTAEFWAGVDKLEAKIKWASIYPEAETALNSPFTAHYFQVRSNLETYTSQGRTQEQPLVYLMTGIFKDAGSMNFKLHEGVDTTSLNLSVSLRTVYRWYADLPVRRDGEYLRGKWRRSAQQLPHQPGRLARLPDPATRPLVKRRSLND